jgi:ubiquinone/menaquinone biosynthesis C-methylase UbiE
VIGLDDNNTTKTTTIKRSIPRNLKLIQHPFLLQGLKGLPDQTFDFIASRFLLLGYTFNEYQELMTECLRLCKPGGYIELMEMDMRIYHQKLLSAPITKMLNNEGNVQVSFFLIHN